MYEVRQKISEQIVTAQLHMLKTFNSIIIINNIVHRIVFRYCNCIIQGARGNGCKGNDVTKNSLLFLFLFSCKLIYSPAFLISIWLYFCLRLN